MVGELCLLKVLEALEVLRVLDVMRHVLLRMLEAVEGELCLLDVLEEMRCVLLGILETVGGRLCWLDALEVPEVPQVMRCMLLCMLLCMLEVVESGLCLLDVLEAMRCVLLCMPEACCGPGDVEVQKYGTLETRCRCSDEPWRHGALEL